MNGNAVNEKTEMFNTNEFQAELIVLKAVEADWDWVPGDLVKQDLFLVSSL